ncbi:MAG: B12-binding domain-containing radical SAM protein [Deltaproteobacteria bacterium]|nr:B12-binding domain-containing radical SAM protein [Deltaproteobacteria bacterium]
MRVLFIKHDPSYAEPLGLMQLSAALKAAGHQTRLVFSYQPDLLAKVRAYRPGVIAYSSTTGIHRTYAAINRWLKRQAGFPFFAAVGGPHVTYFPEFLEQNPEVDGICRGEGDAALPELVANLTSGQDIRHIPNWRIRAEGTIYENEVRPLVSDLDGLPFPDHEILYQADPYLGRFGLKRFLASRGCPFQCSYCFNHMFNRLYRGKGQIVRHMSAGLLIDQMAGVKQKYGLNFVKFVDDNFPTDEDFLDEFVGKYPDRIGRPFYLNLRANYVTEQSVTRLKKAGCVAINMAVESGNDFIRNRVLKRGMSREQILTAASLIKKHGLILTTQNIIGNPGEDFAGSLETYRINLDMGTDFAECFLLQPYPGTEVESYARNNGYYSDQTDSLRESYWVSSPLKFKSAQEKRRIENFHKLFSFVVRHPRMFGRVMRLTRWRPNRLFVFFQRYYDMLVIKRVVMPVPFGWKDYLINISRVGSFITNFILAEKKKPWESEGDGAGC